MKLKLSGKGVKIFKTCNLCLCFITLGMCSAALGPCLLDLQKLVQTDINSIGFIFTALSIGYLLGCLLGGAVLDLIKFKQASLNISNIIIAATFLAIPWCRSIGMLIGLMAINGIFMGVVEVGGNVICLTLWGSDSAPYYQALHFTFGLGGLIAPLIAAPFLENIEITFSSTVNLTAAENSTTDFVSGKNYFTNGTLPNLIYPFSIIGSYGLLASMMFPIVCMIAPTEQSKTKDEIKKVTARPSTKFLASIILINFLLQFAVMGSEVGYLHTVTTYAVKGPLRLTVSVGSYITSAFWAAFTASRFISVFLSMKFDHLSLIISYIIITSLGAAVLLLFKYYEWSLWLSSVLIGAGIASFLPMTTSWVNCYIDVTNKIASVFTVGAAVGEIITPYLITYFIDTVPEVLLYVLSATCIVIALHIFILHMILKKSPKKNERKDLQTSGK